MLSSTSGWREFSLQKLFIFVRRTQFCARKDPGYLRFVVLRSEAAKGAWLAAATAATREESNKLGGSAGQRMSLEEPNCRDALFELLRFAVGGFTDWIGAFRAESWGLCGSFRVIVDLRAGI